LVSGEDRSEINNQRRREMSDEVKKAEVTREFVDGKMIVTMPNGKTREVTQETLQKRIDNITERETKVAARKAETQGWLDQAKASE
jgi:hypothetical protein